MGANDSSKKSPEDCEPRDPRISRSLRLKLFAGATFVLMTGVVWLVQTWLLKVDLGYAWPGDVALFGLYVLGAALLPDGTTGEWLAILGAMILMAGLVVQFQVLVHAHAGPGVYVSPRAGTYHPEVWLYAWTLVVPTAVGIGLAVRALPWRRDRMRRQSGLAAAGLGMFAVAGLLSETVFHIGSYRATIGLWYVAPIVFIVACLPPAVASGVRLLRHT